LDTILVYQLDREGNVQQLGKHRAIVYKKLKFKKLQKGFLLTPASMLQIAHFPAMTNQHLESLRSLRVKEKFGNRFEVVGDLARLHSFSASELRDVIRICGQNVPRKTKMFTMDQLHEWVVKANDIVTHGCLTKSVSTPDISEVKYDHLEYQSSDFSFVNQSPQVHIPLVSNLMSNNFKVVTEKIQTWKELTHCHVNLESVTVVLDIDCDFFHFVEHYKSTFFGKTLKLRCLTAHVAEQYLAKLPTLFMIFERIWLFSNKHNNFGLGIEPMLIYSSSLSDRISCCDEEDKVSIPLLLHQVRERSNPLHLILQGFSIDGALVEKECGLKTLGIYNCHVKHLDVRTRNVKIEGGCNSFYRK
jgi:hypothetical protein